ncbi:hypothetical protein TKK_0015812 [Trichogramma kaykai]
MQKLTKNVSEHLDEYWMLFKTRNNKTYTGREERQRRIAWENNLLKIYEHNLLAEAGHHNYTLRDNTYADLNSRDYIKELVKLVPSRRRRVSDEEMVASVLQDPRRIPRSLDWREKGFVTEPENQEDCGSCYAYSIAGSLAGQIFRQTGLVVQLSEQQLVDCSTQTGNMGCTGGSLRNTLRYLEKCRGIMADASYPYTGEQGACKYQRSMSIVNITSWAVLPARDELSLEAAVATIGPIAASINAGLQSFQLYHSGVYDDPACTSNVVNHAMLIVGYTPDEWILKNWWGDTWGENGYMRLRKGVNRCGIANYAAYAKI